jgi:hypothetical protein
MTGVAGGAAVGWAPGGRLRPTTRSVFRDTDETPRLAPFNPLLALRHALLTPLSAAGLGGHLDRLPTRRRSLGWPGSAREAKRARTMAGWAEPRLTSLLVSSDFASLIRGLLSRACRAALSPPFFAAFPPARALSYFLSAATLPCRTSKPP